MLEGEPGPDHPVQMASDGDHVVVAFTSDEGVITGYASDQSGHFRSGEPTTTGIRFLGLGGVVRLGEGWLAVGSGGLVDDEPEFGVRAFRSTDGRTWSRVDATGLDGAADVAGLTTFDGGVIAIGALRTGEDPAMGGFRPVAWHSADGEAWTTVPLPTGGGTEGSAQALVSTGDEILAVGAVDGTGAMWSSTDGGASWTIVERDGVGPSSSLNDIAVQGDALLISGTQPSAGGDDRESALLLLRSTDDGRHWRVATDPPPPNRGEGFAPLFTGGGRFFTITSSFLDAFFEPELCYADIELCRQGSASSLYVSDDGDRWSRVDTPATGEGQAGRVDAVTGSDQRIVVLTRVDGGVGTWTWPADTPLPTEGEPVDPATEVDLLGENETPKPGRRYGLPLYIHCGMGWLHVGGEPWQRTNGGPDKWAAGDPIPPDWPVAQQTIFGFATLVRDDLIEYSIGDGEVIATYAPSSLTPPGCD